MSIDEFKDTSTYALPIVLIILGLNFKPKYQRYLKAKNKSTFFSLKHARTSLTAISLLIASVIITSIIPDTSPQSPREKVIYGQRIGDTAIELEGLKSLKEQNNDYVLTFNYYKKLIEIQKENDSTKTVIEQLKSSPGNYFDLACIYSLLYEFEKAAFYVIPLNEEEPVVCYLKGQVALYNSDSIGFVNFLIQEVENSGLKKLTYPVLAEYFKSTHQNDLLYDLVKSDTFMDYLDFRLVGSVYYTHGDVYRYAFSTVMHIINHLSIFSFLGALIILIAYTVFLRQIDLFNRESWVWVIIMISYGVISPFFVFPFSNFLEYNVGFTPEDSVIGRFLFYTLRVGLIEEYVKLFPFILFLLFTKKMKEPYDYMFYTALSALGFAFTENIIYFTEHGTAIIQSRGFLSVIGHAVFTSTVGYIMAYSRFKKRFGHPFFVFIIALLIAALLHGLFDFFLTPIPLGIVLFFLYFLILIHVWSVMLNNCMNNSSYFDYAKLPQLKNFQYYATIALLLIITTQYFLTIFYVGKTYAFGMFLGAFYPGLYMLVFLSNTLGRFDFFKNYWEPLMPHLREILIPRTANTNEYVGKHITILAPENSPLYELGNIRGTIVERKIYDSDPNWYMVQTTQALPFSDLHTQLLLISIGDEDISLEDENDNQCQVYGLPSSIDYSKINIQGDFLKAGSCIINLN